MESIISIGFTLLIIVLVILFFVSLFSFIKRIITNSSTQTKRTAEMNEKLDRIIEMLEEGKSK